MIDEIRPLHVLSLRPGFECSEDVHQSLATTTAPFDSNQPRISAGNYHYCHVRVLIRGLANANALVKSIQLRASLRHRNKLVDDGVNQALIDAMAHVYSIIDEMCLLDLHFADRPTGVEFWSHLNSRLHLIDFVMLVFLRKVGSSLSIRSRHKQEHRSRYSESLFHALLQYLAEALA